MILEYKVKKEDTYNLGRVAGTPMFDSNGCHSLTIEDGEAVMGLMA